MRNKSLFLLKALPESERSMYHEHLLEPLQIQIVSSLLDLKFSDTTFENLEVLYKNFEPILYEKILPKWMNASKPRLFNRHIRNFSIDVKLAVAPHLCYMDLTDCRFETSGPRDSGKAFDKIFKNILKLSAANLQFLVTNLDKKIFSELHNLKHLTSIRLSGCNSSMSACFKALKACSQLQNLSLCRFGGYGSNWEEQVGMLTNLRSLSIQESHFEEPQALTPLKRLQQLELIDMYDLYDGQLEELAKMSQLTSLSITNSKKLCRITDKGLEHLKGMTNLRQLSLPTDLCH